MTDTTTSNHPLPLNALQLPEAPGFWPLPWGWWSLLLAMVLLIIAIVGVWKWRKRRLRAKKAAIALLNLENTTISPSGAMEIVRQAVLSYYPRGRVAKLSGESWLSFLDSQVSEPIFTPSGEDWLEALYKSEQHTNREELISQCDQWLNLALPPKRGGRE